MNITCWLSVIPCPIIYHDVFYTDLHGDGKTLFTQVVKNEGLLAARSSILCIEFELHKDIPAFENYLDLNFDSQDQWIEDATRIVKKCDELKKDGYHGDKLLSMCPTNLHWMAIFNDSKVIEVNIKLFYLSKL